MDEVLLYAYAEDEPSVQVASQLVKFVNDTLNKQLRFRPGFPALTRGASKIQKLFPKIVDASSKGLHYLVLADLDRSECAPTLIRAWNQGALDLPPGLVFRVAVRETESWLLADRGALAGFLGISQANFPEAPDRLIDPKRSMLDIIRRKGKKKWHRDMLPQRQGAAIGPLYNEKLCEFVRSLWNPARAKERSPSLERAIRAIGRLPL